MARKKNESKQPTAQEIQEQLDQMDAERKALEAALKKQRAAELSGFANEIKDQIIGRGYTVDDVFSVLSKGRRKPAGKRRSGGYPPSTSIPTTRPTPTHAVPCRCG